MRKIGAAIAASLLGVLAACAYLAMSSPGRLVVSEKGKVGGVINEARAKLQGPRFWEDQLQTAQDLIRWLQAEPEREAKREARLDEMSRRFSEKYPSRKSPAKQKAEDLREEADRIEYEEERKIRDEMRDKKIEKLQMTVRFLRHQYRFELQK